MPDVEGLSEVRDQTGRTVVVTGASSGLGLELSRALATAGARVVMAVRSPEKGEQMAERVRRTGARGPVVVETLDVADLSSVRAFADHLRQAYGGADVLVNNAGIMAVPEGRTVDGFEQQIGTNHLGHFALTNLVLPLLTDRVVVVASTAARRGEVRVDDLDMSARGYRPSAAYAQSKLANLLFVLELQRRLTASGSPLRALAAHPGYTATSITGSTGKGWFTRVSGLGNALLGMPPSQGALSLLAAATADLPGNSYLGPSGPGELRGRPVLVGRAAAASDPALARALWARSEELTGTAYPL